METGLKFRDRDISRLIKTPSFLPPLTNDFWSVQFSLSQKLPRNITKSISKRFETSNSSITALKIPKMRFSLFLPRIFPLHHLFPRRRTTLATLSVSFPGGLHGESLEEEKEEKNNEREKRKERRKKKLWNVSFVCSMTLWSPGGTEFRQDTREKRKRERKKDERRLFSRKLVPTQRGGISHVAKPLSRVEPTWAETPD